MPKIFTALDMGKSEAIRSGGRASINSVYDRIRFLCDKPENRPFVKDSPFTGRTGGNPVVARVDYGRWLADCECGGAEYVDPCEPIFYCCSCGNRDNGGNARPVEFPDTRKEIEDELLRRPVTFETNDPFEFYLKSRPAFRRLARSWLPGETIQDLIDQSSKAGI